MDKMQSTYLQLAQQISNCFAVLPQVEAVAVAGSRGSGVGTADSASDIDFYIYTQSEISVEVRQAIVEQTGGASRSNLNLLYWGLADEWINAPTGIELDITYFDVGWIENQISRVIEKHQASQGYTTCFWHTVQQSIPFFDRDGWFAELQQRAQIDYPEALRQNIIRYNHMVLRGMIPSYANQIEKAVRRGDLVSIHHRTTILLTGYFDILFAVNRLLHPGEKRQVEFARNNCTVLPINMEADLASILLPTAENIPELPNRIASLLDHLDQMLADEGIRYS